MGGGRKRERERRKEGNKRIEKERGIVAKERKRGWGEGRETRGGGREKKRGR